MGACALALDFTCDEMSYLWRENSTGRNVERRAEEQLDFLLEWAVKSGVYENHPDDA